MRVKQPVGGALQGAPSSQKFYDFTQVKLMIGVPTRGNCTMHFAKSLAILTSYLAAKDIPFIIDDKVGSCNVHFNRNGLLATFMHSDATHLLQIDDDMGFEAMAVLKMLAMDRDFIAGAGNKKTDEGKDYACRIDVHADTRPVVDHKGLIKTSQVGGAFVLLKRVVIERMQAHYLHLKCNRIDPVYGFSLYEDVYDRISMESEDYTFCRRWTEIGGEIWIYPNLTFTHTGTKDYIGNYHEFLLKQPQPAPSMEAMLATGQKVGMVGEPNPQYLDMIENSINKLAKQMEIV